MKTVRRRVRAWTGRAQDWRAQRWPRRTSPAYTTPRMRPVWHVLLFWLAIAVFVAWGINSWLRGRPDLIGDAPDPLAVTRVVLTLVGGVGAVFVGVYAYRRQRIEEAASLRADHDQFLSRYNSATEQLAHESPAARLAGVYAMAQLADDWVLESHDGRRQQCVDVLCAYLPMPPKGNAGDEEVRATVLSVIVDHVRKDPSDPNSWSSLNFDFSRADLRDAHLAGSFSSMVTFRDATFRGEAALAWVHFSGGVSFHGATFERLSITGDVSFVSLDFSRARFTDRVSMESVSFSGFSDFSAAQFEGRFTTFSGSYFHDEVTFEGAVFRGSTYFDSAAFLGRRASFAHAEFHSDAHFNHARLGAAHVDLRGVSFQGQIASFESCDLGTDSNINIERATFARACEHRGWDEIEARYMQQHVELRHLPE